MTSVFSWKNSISLCPASFCTPRMVGALDQAKLEVSIHVDSEWLHEREGRELCKAEYTQESEEEGLPVNEIDESEEEKLFSAVDQQQEKQDCECICSTCSNLTILSLSNNQSPNKFKHLIKEEYLSTLYQRKIQSKAS